MAEQKEGRGPRHSKLIVLAYATCPAGRQAPTHPRRPRLAIYSRICSDCHHSQPL